MGKAVSSVLKPAAAILGGPAAALGLGTADVLSGGTPGMAELQRALAEFEKIGIPTEEAMKIIVEQPQMVGKFIPELEGAAEQLQTSALSAIEITPQLEEARFKAIEQLSQQADSGLSDADRAALESAMRRARGEGTARQEAITQNLAERGVLGSGQEIAMRMAAQQGAGQLAAEQANAVAQQANQARLAALEGLSNVRSQEFSEKSALAQAEDEIARFNLQQREAAKQRDLTRTNEANLRNLTEQQRIAEAQVAARNEQEMYNKQVPIQQFNMGLNKVQGTATALGNIAGAQQQSAANKANMITGLVGSVGKGAGAMASDERVKENIKKGNNSSEKLMDELKAYEFNYKGDDDEMLGIMAQDLEKSEAGKKLVKEIDGVKHVDTNKALSATLANQANINERLKRLEKLMR